eukprot:960696-Amphidinium_carterae.2
MLNPFRYYSGKTFHTDEFISLYWQLCLPLPLSTVGGICIGSRAGRSASNRPSHTATAGVKVRGDFLCMHVSLPTVVKFRSSKEGAAVKVEVSRQTHALPELGDHSELAELPAPPVPNIEA